jgi:hypothetical protein
MTTTHDHHPSAPLVPSGSGRVLMDGPLGAVLLAGTADTQGAVSFVVHPIAPRTLGSPVPATWCSGRATSPTRSGTPPTSRPACSR